MSKLDHFNIISPFYDHVFGRGNADMIINLTDLRKDFSLLDVGGGTGRVSARFQEVSNNVIVVDSAFRMLQVSKLKGISTIQSQSERLPFAEELFDRIIMVDVFHHVEDQQQTLNEMWRLLAPGGKIVIEEPDIKNISVKLIALGEKILLMRSHFQKPETIIEMCQFSKEAKFTIHRKNGIAWIIIIKDSAGLGN